MAALIALAAGLVLAKTASANACDIFGAAFTPCVAAHSSTRALYALYAGPLYQVTRGSDDTTKDIHPVYPGGPGNAGAQDAFCAGTACYISIIYDQSGNNNNLYAAPSGGAAAGVNNGVDLLAGATGAPVTLNGQRAYGIFSTLATGYRQDNTNHIPTGGQAQTIYAVVDGTHYNDGCCFDYGNAETDNHDDGASTMESLYFGSLAEAAPGAGSGPWFQADLENGLFAGNQVGSFNPQNPSITSRFATGMLKSSGTKNEWAIRGGDSNSGQISTYFEGTLPSGYYPLHQQGAIILGIGGDNSDSAQGTFYEGAIIAGETNSVTDALVAKDIQAAGYAPGKLTSGPAIQTGSKVRFQATNGLYLTNNNGAVSLTSDNTDTNSEWLVHPGLGQSSCLSFESVAQSGNYIRHDAYQLQASNAGTNGAEFNDDATWCPESAFAGEPSSDNAFRSFSYPGRFWRWIASENVYIGQDGGPFQQDSATNFDAQASWQVIVVS